VAASSYDHLARVWNVADGAELARLKGHEAPVDRAVFSPDGRHIVTAGRDGSARIWDAAPARRASSARRGSYALSGPDGTRVLTASEQSGAILWDANTGAQLMRPHQHKADLRFLQS
jgi:WD40 repeat protein